MNNKVSEAINDLYVMFDEFNKWKFDGKLERPIIVIISDKRKSKYGHITTSKIWKDGDSEKFEIGITAEFLNLPIENVQVTMMHEMVHEYNLMNGIKDFSGKAHNKKFKSAAESVGLVVEKGKYGWAYTPSFDKATAEEVKKLNIRQTQFDFYKEGVETPEAEKTPSYKYSCDECEVAFTLKKKFSLTCNGCNKELKVEEKQPKE